MSGVSSVPEPRNEPVFSYAPGTAEREELKSELSRMSEERPSIPLVVGNEKMTGNLVDVVMPHDHRHVLARASSATAAQVARAIDAAEEARPAWAALDFDARAAILLRAADLVTGKYRARINAATMLGQSKTAHQAEIEAACEHADFYRFNVHFADQLRRDQPYSPPGQWNRVELRPLDGFVFAIAPFNFTAIAGNLPTAPALMGNTSVWKPSPQQIFSAHVTMEILQEAGMPPGVINLVAGDPSMIGEIVLKDPRLGGVHFTGSTGTFQYIHRVVGENIASYRQYPRIVGETGGKDFIFVHPSADIDAVSLAVVRGAFEYQGQKCSAASRVYVPSSRWPALRDRLVPIVEEIPVGDIRDFRNFMGAVIDSRAFQRITGYIERGKTDPDTTLIAGGTHDDSVGYFVRPTIFETLNPHQRLMTEEIFGPVVTFYVYDEKDLEQTLDLCDSATPYALTGAVFAEDRYAVEHISRRLRGAAGNFYIN
ncbi:MAG: L-glutamate gamma-semialdehyde dehydrogenase, partial [Myxococcota bacterium]